MTMYMKGFKMTINYKAPILGEHHDVSMTHDDTFSAYLVGKGFVIYPTDHNLYAPIDGVISHIFPTKHAIAIKHSSGVNVLIHLGFGTVDLKGQGITSYIKVNQEVKQGDLLLSFDFDYLKQNLQSMDIPVVFMQKENLKIISTIEESPRINLILDVS